MVFSKTSIDGVFIIEPEKREDGRGYFARVFCREELKKAGIDMNAVQINTSYNLKKFTLRGLHFQEAPHSEIKIVRCVRGAIYDVAVDIRTGSPTFGRYVSAELTPENGRMLLVPKGFAHGYLTLRDESDVIYFVSDFYAPGAEKGYRYDDPLLDIDWPSKEQLIISEKDLNWGYCKF